MTRAKAITATAEGSSSSSAWAQRHARIAELSVEDVVEQAHDEALHAASLIQQTDENAANVFAANAASERLVSGCDKVAEDLGRKLDVSLAILWSVPRHLQRRIQESSHAGGSRHGTRADKGVDINATRQRALFQLQQLAEVALSESSRDLAPICCLESSREGTVELVRCAFDRKIYVLKSTTKGAAKRNYRTNAPMTERRLLTLARQAKRGTSAFTPACLASFQSPGSLHILMEYCPAGDLYHFLDSAGQAPISNEVRSKSGGLLVEEYVRKYTIDMVAAISWLHEKEYMHRDLKPGNWLFDPSGHLVLCDLASAAPFATFDEVPASASLPLENGTSTSQTRQRRVLYRHCCLIGTADYIAPEVFYAADLMSRRQMQKRERSMMGLTPSRTQAADTLDDIDGSDDEEDDEPPPEGPGLYGPECDWWSLGVIIFEMVYKRMPFFSESIAETMEMIKDHANHLSLDPWVHCSANLKDLITHLMTRAEGRLGHQSSAEVQAHPFFRHVDWEKPWQEAAPFVPILPEPVDDGLNRIDAEPSVLHSPLPDQQSRSFCGNSFAASRMWDADAEDFPAFPNSVELSRDALLHSQGTAERGGDDVSSSNMTHHSDITVGRKIERSLEFQWTDFDPTWIGFTRIAEADAFDSLAIATVERSQAPSHEIPLPQASSPTMRRLRDGLDARTGSKKATDLHRKVLETSSSANAHDRFKTPLRKKSYASMSNSGSVPPTSPYPFPIATSTRPRKTPGPGTVLRHRDLERARSVSASTGEGSDSRCSGGSNAKRDISEREAWNELKVAVMRSARKSQQHPLRASQDLSRGERSVDTEGDDEEESSRAQLTWLPDSSSQKRVSFQLKPGKLATTGRSGRHALLPNSLNRRTLVPVVQQTPPGGTQSKRQPSSSPSSPLPESHAGEDELIDPTDYPASKSVLSKRESARQLLLRAQHRETPTRTARPASPFVQDMAQVEGDVATKAYLEAEERGSDVAGSSPIGQRSAILLQHFTGGNNRESTPQMNRIVKAPHRPAPQLARHSVLSNLKRQGTLKRRDSRETLSQYRLGINPDDFVDLQPTETRRRSGTRSLERQTSSSRIDVLRANSSLGLLRETSVRSPSIPSVPDAFLGPASIPSGESSTSTSDIVVLASQSADAALQRPPSARRALRPIENLQRATVRQTSRSASRTASPKGSPDHIAHRQKRSENYVQHGKDGDVVSNPAHQSKPSPPVRPSLLKRASSYLRSLAPDSAKREPQDRRSHSPRAPALSSPLRKGSAHELDSHTQGRRASSPLQPASKSASGTRESSANATSSTTSMSQSSLTVTRLHARYDHLQADIADLERRLVNVRSLIASSSAV